MNISIYKIEDTPIGGGGMGNVYRGYDPQGNRVAVKRMHPHLSVDANMRDLFHKEINTLRQLEHESVVKMYGSFEEHGVLYLIMQYVEGKTIDQCTLPLSESEATKILCEILPALTYIHGLGFVHRDIKPNNIIIKQDGKICLLDFGVVKDMKNSNGHTIGQIIGTDGYMSPEQAEGLSINHRSDIYSLGCVLFYMLTGRTPYVKQTNDFATRQTIIEQPFPRAKSYNPNISDNIQRILDKATNKNMLQRFQSCREFELEIRGGATVIRTDSSNDENTISVGRESCDIIFTSQKVSRRHLDITKQKDLQSTNGWGVLYIIRDRSTNGTMINGEKIQNGEKTIQSDNDYHWHPKILLAGEVELNWEEVEAAFARKQPAPTPTPKPKPTPAPIANTTEGQDATGRLIAIYIFAALGGLPGLIFGIYVYRQTITLPDGNKTPKYKQSHRTAALIGAILSGISMFIWRLTM